MALKKRGKGVARWVEKGPRAVWMERYVQWLVGQPGAELTGTRAEYRSRYPTSDERAARASFFATRPVQEQLIPLLEKRPDIREYFEKVRSDAQYHAKELARQEVAENFEIRREGLRKAAGRKVDTETGEVTYAVEDVKAIEHYTRPYLELAHPKKPREEPGVQRYVINLFGASAEQKAMVLKAAMGEPPDEIEYEIVEQKQITDGLDD